MKSTKGGAKTKKPAAKKKTTPRFPGGGIEGVARAAEKGNKTAQAEMKRLAAGHTRRNAARARAAANKKKK